jgi:hypothetical protein
MKISLFKRTPRQDVLRIDTTNTPTRVGPLPDYMASRITLWARNAWNTANTGTVYLGWSQAGQPITLLPGVMMDIWAPPSVGYDIYELWVRVDTAGDGIVYAIYP